MGATGHSNYRASRTGNVNDETFNIPGAVNYRGKLPEDSGLEKVGNNKITLKVASTDKQDIYFQFKLLKNGKMSILAHDPNVPTKGKVVVDADRPSLDEVIANGTKAQKAGAIAVRTMMNKSSRIDEGQLTSIANKLKARKG